MTVAANRYDKAGKGVPRPFDIAGVATSRFRPSPPSIVCRGAGGEMAERQRQEIVDYLGLTIETVSRTFAVWTTPRDRQRNTRPKSPYLRRTNPF